MSGGEVTKVMTARMIRESNLIDRNADMSRTGSQTRPHARNGSHTGSRTGSEEIAPAVRPQGRYFDTSASGSSREKHLARGVRSRLSPDRRPAGDAHRRRSGIDADPTPRPLRCADLRKDSPAQALPGGGPCTARRSAPGRTRTCGQVLRRHLLYPLSYGGRVVASVTWSPGLGGSVTLPGQG